MRIAVFILAFYLSITPALAWFQLAVAGASAVGTIVDIAGDFKKIPSKKGLAATGTAAIKYCAKNKKCKEKFGDLLDEINESDNDDYHTNDGDLWCDGRIYIQAWNNIGSFGKPKIYTDSFEHYCQLPSLKDATSAPPFSRNHKFNGTEEMKGLENPNVYCNYSYETFSGRDVKVFHRIGMYCDQNLPKPPKSTDSDEQKKKKKEKLEADLAIQIVNDLDDIEISDFLNDYSNDIDIDKYCSKNACDDIENNFAKQINEYDYDIDKINKNNCTVKNGKIVSCEYAKKKKSDDDDDDDDEQNNTDDTKRRDDDDESTDKKDDDKCPAFLQKICDFEFGDIEETPPPEANIDFDFKGMAEKQYIDFTGSCPAPLVIDLSGAYGTGARFEWSYMPLCSFAEQIKPAVIFTASLSALYIVIIGRGIK